MDRKSRDELKKEAELVRNRRLDNVREINELKASLQSLITQGLKQSENINALHGKENINNLQIQENTKNRTELGETKVQRSKSSNRTVTVINKKESPKKSKSYNVEEAREYIKKQNEKRSEQLKNNVKNTATQNEIKKQRLLELQKKSQEIVARNLELKRERSRSKGPKSAEQLRPDYAGPPSNIRSNSKEKALQKEEDLTHVSRSSRSRSRELEKKEVKIPQNKVVSKNVPQITTRPGRPRTRQQNISTCRSKNEDLNLQQQETQKANTDVKNAKSLLHPNSAYEIFQHIKSKEVTKKLTETKTPSVSDEKITSESEQTQRKNVFSPSKPPDNQNQAINIFNNITVRSELNQNRENSCRVDLKKDDSDNKKQSDKAVIEKLKLNSSKETQTFDPPHWLCQNTSKNENPYNFINTVRRRLESAIMQPSTKTHNDKGVQSSLRVCDHVLSDRGDIVFPQSNFPGQQISKNVENSNLKSFISHKCLNLDPKPVEHLGLQIGSKKSEKSNKSILLISNESESEDTSKNIPEISSESITTGRNVYAAAKKDGGGDDDFNLKINTSNLNKMKLKSKSNIQESSLDQVPPEVIDNISSIRVPSRRHNSRSAKSSKNLFPSKTSYTSDYNSESDLDNSFLTGSHKSAEYSILAGNISSYSNLVNKNFRPHSSNSKHSTEQQSIPEEIQHSKEGRVITESGGDGSGSLPTLAPQEYKSLPTCSSSIRHSNMNSDVPTDISTLPPQIYNDIPTTHSSISKLEEEKVENDDGRKKLNSFKNNNTDLVVLQEPQISLKIKNLDGKNKVVVQSQEGGEQEKTNQIHLKFETEIHLLNDFNKSFSQLNALEKALESLKTTNTIQQVERTMNESATITEQKNPDHSSKQNILSQINFSRGSEVSTVSRHSCLDTTSLSNRSAISTRIDLLNNTSRHDDDTTVTDSMLLVSVNENYDPTNPVGMSLKLLEQLIKDEDSRLKNLKTMLKIREKSLQDRVLTELQALEVQKRNLRLTGKLQEASLVKKKQRGILLKHSEEKHEMQRLKQLHKAKSKERISELQQERKLIKTQLCTDKMLTNIKVNTPRVKRSNNSGPLRVVTNHHTESVISERSISRRSSVVDEVVNVSTTKSVTSVVSEIESHSDGPDDRIHKRNDDFHVTHIKKALLMREAALDKRRREAENLLKWHQKLLDDERRIVQLEQSASTVVSQQPTLPTGKLKETPLAEDRCELSGTLLNQLWSDISDCTKKRFADEKTYRMSKAAFSRICKNASEYKQRNLQKMSSATRQNNVVELSVSDLSKLIISPEQSDSDKEQQRQQQQQQQSKSSSSISINDAISAYKSDFEIDSNSVRENTNSVSEHQPNNSIADQQTISSISDLIENFNKIEEEMSKRSEKLVNESNQMLTELDEFEVGAVENDETTSVKTATQISLLNSLNSIKPLSNCENDVIAEKNSHKTLSNDSKITIHSQSEKISDISNISEKFFIDKNGGEGQLPEKQTSSLSSREPNTPTNEINALENSILEKSNVQISELITDKISSEIISQESTDTNSHSKQIESSDKITPHQSNSTISEINHIESADPSEIINTPNKDFFETSHVEKSDTINSELNHSIVPTSDKGVPSDVRSQKSQVTIFELSNVDEPSEKVSSDLTSPEISSNSEVLKKTSSDIPDGDCGVSVKSVETEEHHDDELPKSLRIVSAKSDSTDDNSKSVKSVRPKISTDISEEKISERHPYVSEQEEEINEVTNSLPISDLSYGVLEKGVDLKSDKFETDVDEVESCAEGTTSNIKSSLNELNELNIDKTEYDDAIPKEIEFVEEKEHDSLSEISNNLASEIEEKSQSDQVSEIIEEKEISYSSCTPSSECGSDKRQSSSTAKSIDVKKRVSEIMAEAGPLNLGDKSTRMQDLYVTTYDVNSPPQSPEPVNGEKIKSPKNLDTEAEELLRKQLAIEQEIKELEQQQKELPYVFVREIPNKPPPPYTPPANIRITAAPIKTILPAGPDQIDEITRYSAKIIHKAYLNNNLENINISENTLNLITKNNISKECYRFVFDICKEIAVNHYKQFKKEPSCPSWMKVATKCSIAPVRPFDLVGLERHMSEKLKEMFKFQKRRDNLREKSVMKWSRKKKDHVDEILILESQLEEAEWTYYDKDERIVMDNLTNEIMNMLLQDTAKVMQEIFRIKNCY